MLYTMGGIGATAFAAVGLFSLYRTVLQPAPLPMVLQSVERIGDLRTARRTYTQVYRHETQLEPAAWALTIPGATEVVHLATRNRALLTSTGTVEAGIDMRRAQVYRSVNGHLIVEVPQPQVYPAQVDARVQDARLGLFWRDDNLALESVDAIRNQLERRAESDGICREARENAEHELTRLIPGVREGAVEIHWADA